MLGSAFLFAVLNGLIKILGPAFRVWDIGFYRFAFGLAMLLVISGWDQNPFKSHNLRLLIMRGITGSMAFISLVTAIRLIPISTAMVIFYSFPAFAALCSFLLFGESITKSELSCVLVAFIGVTVLFDFRLEGGLVGQTMALISGSFAGLTVSIVKKLRENNGPIIIYLYFCLLGTVITFPRFISDPQSPTNMYDWLILAGIGCASISAQLLMNEGFRYCKSWEGGLFLTSEVIFASVFGLVFLSESVTWRFWVGGILIFTSVVVLNLGSTRRRPRFINSST
jgi:drug/metabolite transporter (DMT)-like permease